MSRLALLVLLAALPCACHDDGATEPVAQSAWTWDLPAHFPEPVVPDDNPMNEPKVELGRHLFYDERLSGDGTQSCATCHRQELAFTDGLARSEGIAHDLTPRSSMSLGNVAYASRLTWANPLIERLEHQAMAPLFGEEPVEMGMAGREDELVARLQADEATAARFEAAFPGEADPITVPNVLRAIASFERTLISSHSPYDRYVAGDAAALDASQQRGMRLFLSERLECFHCHGGFNFSDSVDHAGKGGAEVAFHQTGLYDEDGAGEYPAPNTGTHAITGKDADMGRFRAPTLRNIAVTAPYMHDGSIATLDQVIDHYAAGGRARSARTSDLMPGFVVTPREKADLVAFLGALTDEQLLTDPRFSDPTQP